MFPASKILVACFLPLALAQYGAPAGSSGSSMPSSVAAATAATTSFSTSGVQTVTVGANNALAFSPNSITAAVGSSIEFVFSPPEHSVVEGVFDSPCTPSNNSGFYSGLMTTSSGTNANVFTITINDTNPIWFFCGFPAHCGLGMVGVINPPSDGSQTLAEYSGAASKVSNAPKISLPVQGGTVGPAKAVSTSSSISSAATTSSTAKSVAVREFETGGSTQWAVMALTGVLALGVGSLIM